MNPHVFKGRSNKAPHIKGSPKGLIAGNGQRICPIALGKKTYHNDDKELLKELDKFEYSSQYANKPIGNRLDAKLEESLESYQDDSLEIDWDNISKRKAKKLAKRGIYPPHPLNFHNDNPKSSKIGREPYHKYYKIKRNYQDDYSSRFLK